MIDFNYKGCSALSSVNRSFFISIAAELENYELYWLIRDDFETDQTVWSFCREFEELKFIDSASDRVISFIASHFTEIDRSFLIRLPISILERVLLHDSLRIESEESLYAFVISVIEVCGGSVSILSGIRFEYLGIDVMTQFILWSFDHFEKICESFSIWQALSVRLSLSVSPVVHNGRVLHRTFLPSTDSSLDGIICHLSCEHGGNVHDRGIVDISAKSISCFYYPKHAADLQSAAYFHSLNAPDQWLCYDFKDLRVWPTHYSIHVHSTDLHLRSWILEGSKDGSSWIGLDEQQDNSTTNSSHPIGTFSVSQSSECRFIHLRQTGKNASESDWLILLAFEIFGRLMKARQSQSQ